MKMITDDPALALAQHVCRTSYADLPASAVESARRDILDTFGCMLGGSGSPAIGELFAVVSRWGGMAESRVLLRGVSLPSPQAALLNASMGHALDFDDTLDTGWVEARSTQRKSEYADARVSSRSCPARGCIISAWSRDLLKQASHGLARNILK
jgi:hypothetical protein